MLKSMELIRSIVSDWAELYKSYDRESEKYNSTPKIIRWWKNMPEPNPPGFNSTTVYEKYDKVPVIVELRCYSRTLYIAVRVDNKGFLENLSTGEKTALLGSRGKNINDFPETEEIQKILTELRKLTL